MLDERMRDAEWLEADGLGGFASGTVGGPRSRRYHALLLAATAPPAGRFVLVNGLEAGVETPTGRYALTSNLYGGDVVHPDGARRIESFTSEPWPRWVFALEDGTRVEHEVFAVHESPAVVLTWKLAEPNGAASLSVRPMLSGRDPHALHRENPAFRFDAELLAGGWMRWRPYDGVPAVHAWTDGSYRHAPEWFRNFLYAEERARGLDFVEDLASPGVFDWDLGRGPAWLVLSAEPGGFAPAVPRELADRERRRRAAFPSTLHRAADSYLVRRGSGKTVVAGYPWFGDWGRDTFIALRGLCLAGGRAEDAGAILEEWTSAVSEGMLPNRFPDRGDVPEYNSVDASLWFVVAVYEYLETATRRRVPVARSRLDALRGAVDAILDGYTRGTRFGIRCDDDGLLAAGEPGWQLTWMDAKVGDWVVTPRVGKPVEVQALWLNALRAGASWNRSRSGPFERGRRSFAERFWNAERSMLFDVVDVDHVAGRNDPAFRPNQVFAVGGLPWSCLEDERARRVVDAVEAELWTPLGPRSLAAGEAGYVPRYEGGVRERDGAYHQGTVWPWLAGPFVQAWVRVRGGTAAARRQARTRFLDPLLVHLGEAGIGHVSEIADAEAPHRPRGCPFQAWSLGELLRLEIELPAASPVERSRKNARASKTRRASQNTVPS